MNCTSCGMPLRTPEDHASGDVTKEYCRHCAHPDGQLKSYDEVLAGMTAFLQRTQGLDPGVARRTATATMAKMPAWSGRA
ncbi:MAG: zinc ribbon domain-containing protein [Myxococcaceae bacterium]|nr:zinc ribbon domain-containing protein [Myxococcaceae bacterium]